MGTSTENYNVLLHIRKEWTSLQFYTDCQRLVEVTERFFGTKGTSQSPYYRAAGDLGEGRGRRRVRWRKNHRADGIFSGQEVRLEPGVCGREKKKAFV